MIIIIDDNKDLVYITCELLSIMGYEATAALSGEEGIAKAKKRKPEVIICDIGMANMNGYDVAKYIRNDNELKDVCLIAMSGYSSQKDVVRSIEAGFNMHICKPVSLEGLKAVLDEACNR